MPDLELLKAGDSAEWEIAWDELHLWDVAKRSAAESLGTRCNQEVEDVALNALKELCERAIHRCHGVNHIIPMTRRIAKNRAIDFLRRFWARFVDAGQAE